MVVGNLLLFPNIEWNLVVAVLQKPLPMALQVWGGNMGSSFAAKPSLRHLSALWTEFKANENWNYPVAKDSNLC